MFKELILIISLISWCGFAYPYSSLSIPTSRLVFSEDKKLVYVEWRKAGTDPISFDYANIKYPKDEFTKIRYPENGLYEIDSRKFLFKLSNGDELGNDIMVLNDKQYLIQRHGSVIEIYKHGVLNKKYDFGKYCEIYYPTFTLVPRSQRVDIYDLHVNQISKEISFGACNHFFNFNIVTGQVVTRVDLLKAYGAPVILLILFLFLFFLGIKIFMFYKNKLKMK